MQKRLWIRLVGLAAMGGLVLAGFTGCKRNEPIPKPSSSTTTTSKSAATTALITTTTTTSRFTSAIATTETTQPDPLGYWDDPAEDAWPMRYFYSVDGFVNWIENTDFKIEESPYIGEEGGEYKSDFFETLYPKYEQMFALERYCLLPDVPDDWRFVELIVESTRVTFGFADSNNTNYHFDYTFRKPRDTYDETSMFFAFQKTVNGKEYYIEDMDTHEVAKKRGRRVRTFMNGYLCSISISHYNPEKKDTYPKYFDNVYFTEDSDLTEAISLLKFKRIDLPPLE